MRTKIVRIGNSQGVRIPKPLIEQARLGREVEISVQDGSLVIKPIAKARIGRDDAFAEMARLGDDAQIDTEPLASTAWDEDDWQW